MIKAIRHGELLLVPVKTKNKKWEKKKDYIASHSETGHHHVVMGMSYVFSEKGKNVIMRIKNDTVIEHKKSHDKHDTKPVLKGDYELIKKTEYDPIMEVVREVWD